MCGRARKTVCEKHFGRALPQQCPSLRGQLGSKVPIDAERSDPGDADRRCGMSCPAVVIAAGRWWAIGRVTRVGGPGLVGYGVP